jgi:hypothetical protein
LNIGDYVRTKRNGIIKIDEIIDNGIITHEDDFGREWEEETNLKVIRYNDKDGWNKGINENDVIKSSPNIIDLIEVGDYVNGERVIALEKDVDKRNIYPSNLGAKIFTDYELQGNWYFGIQEEEIKTIVTKEQFESMEYKL